MIAVVQRVSQASVYADNKEVSRIGDGMLILAGFFDDDTQEDVDLFVQKVIHLRIMADAEEKMNLSLMDTKGEVLLVSQFTLCGDVSYGRRPSFHKAMAPTGAQKLYHHAVEKLESAGITVKTGIFGKYMDVRLRNDGPVTLIINTRE